MRLGGRRHELRKREREPERTVAGIDLVIEVALDLAAAASLVDDPVAGIGPQPAVPPFLGARQREMSLRGHALVQRLHRRPVGQHQAARAARLLRGRQHRGGEREPVDDLGGPVPKLAIERVAERIQHRQRPALLPHLPQRRAHQGLGDAAAAMLGRHGDRAHARDRESLAAHERGERVEHERRHDAPVELADPHVAQPEAGMIGVELAALLEARHPIRPGAEVGERLDIGAAGRTVAQRRRAQASRAHGRAMTGREPWGPRRLCRDGVGAIALDKLTNAAARGKVD